MVHQFCVFISILVSMLISASSFINIMNFTINNTSEIAILTKQKQIKDIHTKTLTLVNAKCIT